MGRRLGEPPRPHCSFVCFPPGRYFNGAAAREPPRRVEFFVDGNGGIDFTGGGPRAAETLKSYPTCDTLNYFTGRRLASRRDELSGYIGTTQLQLQWAAAREPPRHDRHDFLEGLRILQWGGGPRAAETYAWLQRPDWQDILHGGGGS